MLFPIIKVYDKDTKTTHIVGSNIHDMLTTDNESISYYNLQNGECTNKNGSYIFEGIDDGEYPLKIEFVSFKKLKEIYNKQVEENKRKKILRDKLIESFFDEDSNDKQI